MDFKVFRLERIRWYV